MMNVINIMNTIWDNSSSDYQARIPQANKDNIEEIRYAMIDDDNIMVANEFAHLLLNKLVKTRLLKKMFVNPLKSLKKGKKPLGDTVEEVYNNFIKGQPFDGNGNTTALMGRTLPDAKVVYHRMNSKLKYPVTISTESLSKAFSSWDNLEAFINNILDNLYNSAELDEYLQTKELIKSALEQKAMKVIPIKDPLLSKENAEAFIKQVKTVSGLMAFPSEKWNSYLEAQSKDEKPITTFSKKSEQVLIIDTATDTSVSVDVLANTFNMSVAEFNDTKKIVIDYFPDRNIRAALVDEWFFQIYDDKITVGTFNNGESLYTNYWLHVWQTFAYSILVNGVVFSVAEDSDSDGEVETFTVTTSLVEGAKSSNKRKTANEGSTYSTTLSGEYSSVSVTMGGATQSDAYDDETKNISIPEVTGDIVITIS